ncbi:hypothetical protein TH66_19255 [Carbonactinospora thermoautotrophica]|uniref:Copper resistance protein D domain-containing protein n=1 Tax=Carbonactinospora thermoautotrophica TaxID=1469144 RepID=A0A132MIJ2_9ACTN|nr:hypothetical protein [Carbonactinospora thermoautotrophica]KWW97672.1 hypothetical protein TH66_19255 [Carbonactinospora thermoautotrophica]KWX03939.1 hypothetical protein TR74_24475 [Carbonactinospora thermoautotrophica]
MTGWSVIRFLHVTSAALWVGGQLTVSLVVLPLARRMLDGEQRGRVLREIGRRFGLFTGAVFLPVQIGTGVLLAWHKGVTWESLAYPGYGRILAAKFLLFTAVMAAAGLHGWANGRGQAEFARAMAVTSLVGSVGIVLLAAALPPT